MNYTSIKNSKSKLNIFSLQNIICFFIALVMILIISNPARYINSCYNGLLIWVKNVLPCLFPFLVCTKILTELNIFSKFTKFFEKITYKLFKAPPIASYALLISMISGYPVGAKVILDLYQNKQISSKTANKLCTFCSTSGPIFVVGTVGTIMLKSATLGVIILSAHLISNIINGIIFKKAFVEKDDKQILDESQDINYGQVLSKSMSNAITSVLVVGGFIAIFYLLIDMLTDAHILNFIGSGINILLSPLKIKIGDSIASGLIEITRGCLDISKLNCSNLIKCVSITGIISFGGFSIHCQSLSFLCQAHINVKFYFLQKLVHTFISIIIAILLCLILGI